ncbi:MAG: hypothetical protein JNG83_01170 [Opitutaceae bacterium]|nr:hypothetical protein [Opitutaceae bacterium]
MAIIKNWLLRARECRFEQFKRQHRELPRGRLLEITLDPQRQEDEKTAAHLRLDEMDREDRMRSESAEETRHASLMTRVDSIERVATKPEHKKFGFWLSIISCIVAVVALVISYCAWRYPAAIPASNQSTSKTIPAAPDVHSVHAEIETKSAPEIPPTSQGQESHLPPDKGVSAVEKSATPASP